MKNIFFVNFADDKYFNDVMEYMVDSNDEGGNFLSLSWNRAKNDKIINISIAALTLKLIEQNSIKLRYSEEELHNIIKKNDKILIDLIIDRVAIKPISSWEKNRYINLLMNYWIGILEENKEMKVLFEATPHFPWDYALKTVCEILNIEYYIIRRPSLTDVLYLTRGINQEFDNFIKINKGKKITLNIQTINKENTYIIRSKSLNRTEKSLGVWLGNFIKENKWKTIIIGYQRIKRIAKGWIQPVANKNYYFNLSFIEHLFFRIKRNIIRKKNLNIITGVQLEEIKTNINYVVFFMHFRPERTTIPESGMYSDQISAIKKLSDLLPENYQIFVKEHPRMFADKSINPDIRLNNFHFSKDYEIISNIDKVKIISHKYDSAKLIENAKLIATLTGTAAWESLIRKKPSLTFAKVWHSTCSSSKSIDEINSTQDLIDLMDKNSTEVEEDLNNFLANMAEFLFEGAGDEVMTRYSKTERIKLVQSCGEALNEIL